MSSKSFEERILDLCSQRTTAGLPEVRVLISSHQLRAWTKPPCTLPPCGLPKCLPSVKSIKNGLKASKSERHCGLPTSSGAASLLLGGLDKGQHAWRAVPAHDASGMPALQLACFQILDRVASRVHMLPDYRALVQSSRHASNPPPLLRCLDK